MSVLPRTSVWLSDEVDEENCYESGFLVLGKKRKRKGKKGLREMIRMKEGRG